VGILDINLDEWRGEMGIHICLIKNDKDHPGWDFLRQGHDKEFPSLIDWDKVEYREDIKWDFRPTNLEELKIKIHGTEWEDKGRYLHLIDLIENDPDCWMYFSY
jgi:hypothetical protein